MHSNFWQSIKTYVSSLQIRAIVKVPSLDRPKLAIRRMGTISLDILMYSYQLVAMNAPIWLENSLSLCVAVGKKLILPFRWLLILIRALLGLRLLPILRFLLLTILSSLFFTSLAGIYLGSYWIAENIYEPLGWWVGIFTGLIFTGLVIYGWIQVLGRMPRPNAGN